VKSERQETQAHNASVAADAGVAQKQDRGHVGLLPRLVRRS